MHQQFNIQHTTKYTVESARVETAEVPEWRLPGVAASCKLHGLLDKSFQIIKSSLLAKKISISNF